ncbi:MAG: hypothetical protein JWM11_5571 [Planctomycetaceae bacterium]|nr:hypothetical protein [Planctomycetaceae bacterium]
MEISAKAIVFRERMRLPKHEREYVDWVIDSHFRHDKPRLIDSKVLLMRPGNMLHLASASRFYNELVATRKFPNWGTYSDYWFGTDPDGSACVALFFNAEESPFGDHSTPEPKQSWWQWLFG